MTDNMFDMTNPENTNSLHAKKYLNILRIANEVSEK